MVTGTAPVLPPRYLDGLADALTAIYSRLETSILCDMAGRLSDVTMASSSDEVGWRAMMLSEAGGLKGDVKKILARYNPQIQKEVERLCKEAMTRNMETDNVIFKAATGRTVSSVNAHQMQALIKKCKGNLSRLTLTTAADSQKRFITACNDAYMAVATGANDYNNAMKAVCTNLAKEGVTAVSYGGRVHSIESAIRTNIMTGINQTAAQATLDNCAAVGMDLVEVSAHEGARPEHEAWQGKVYSKSGTSDKYPPFSICGLGEADGICGINCRHSFYPYFEGRDRHYTQNDLDAIASEKVSYKGQEMTRYEGEQKLRGIERHIRQYKRQVSINDAAGIDDAQAKARLAKWQALSRDFTQKTGLRRDSNREWVASGA